MEVENLPEGLAASRAPEIARKLKSISGGKVLDVATGNGGFIDTLMKALKDYNSFVGIDSSEKDVKAARKRFKGKPVEIIKMNAEALKFEDDSFDTVCISYSLHHLSNIDRVLAEMKRVLNYGGYFIVQESFSDGTQTEAQKSEILHHHWDAEIDALYDITHNNTFAKRKIKNITEGLKLKEVEAIESTHPVKCMFCEEKFECENPKTPKMIKQSIKEVDTALKRLETYSDSKTRNRLRKEGDKLKERLKEFGAAPASTMFFIGKK